MAVRKYTADQLLHLRQSPLVRKPDNLPAIEQWIEYVYADKDSKEKLRIHHSPPSQAQQGSNPREQARRLRQDAPGEGSPMGSFGAGSRPSLMQTRGTNSRAGDDVTLGPPKTVFSSSRNVARVADLGDKSSTAGTGDGIVGDESESARPRFFGDRQSNRKSYGDRDGKDGRESWTSRRTLGGDDEQGDSRERSDRYNRRDRDRDQNGERRNGYGDKQDRRWGRADESDRASGEKRNDWRTRDRRDRDNGRGQGEKDPEWMDEPVRKQEDDLGLGTAHTQEEFQKWKDMMSGKKPQSDEKASTPSADSKPALEAEPAKRFESLKLDGVGDKPFGSAWSEAKKEAALDSAPAPAKAPSRSGKASRFASMFTQPTPKEELPPMPSPPVPPQTNTQKVANAVANGSTEDKEGFQRILQMLGTTGISQQALVVPKEPTSPPAKSGKQKSRFTGFFDQAKSPERKQSPPSGFQPQFISPETESLPSGGISRESAGSMFGARLPERSVGEPPSHPQDPQKIMMHGTITSQNGASDQRPASGRPLSDNTFAEPPSRGSNTPDVNIQNLLAAQQRPSAGQQIGDKNSQFLLNLLQNKSPRPPSSQAPPQQQGRPRSGFQLWMDQGPPETHAPKPRVAAMPTGMFEDQLLRNAPPQEQMQQPQPRHEIPPTQAKEMGMPQRRISSRAPPGFADEQPFYMQQQPSSARRTFTEPPQPLPPGPGRRISGHPNMPPLQTQHPNLPPDFPFLQSPQNPQAPPPGLPHMRHPPGFANIPNIFQAPQPQGQPPQPREPPGFGMASPPNAPPGFFNGPQGVHVPPGFMGMRSPTDGIPTGAPGMRGRGYEGFDAMGQRR